MERSRRDLSKPAVLVVCSEQTPSPLLWTKSPLKCLQYQGGVLRSNSNRNRNSDSYSDSNNSSNSRFVRSLYCDQVKGLMPCCPLITCYFLRAPTLA